MIRRWSHVNTIYNDLHKFDKFRTNAYIINFKSLVFLRNTTIYVTKYKRKFFLIRKRRSAFLVFFNFFFKWLNDYLMVKQCSKYLFLNNILKFNLICFNFNLFLKKFDNNENLFNFFNKKVYYTFFFNFNKNFKHSNNLFIYSNKENIRLLDKNHIVLLDKENSLYIPSTNLIVDIKKILNDRIYSSYLEIYKILFRLFYLKLFYNV